MRVSFRDVLEGRAYIRLSAEAKAKLCHLAGAPWNDKAPGAQLHGLQVEALGRPEREKIVHGGSQLGKSVLGGCEGICALMVPGNKIAVVAALFSHVNHEFKYIAQGMRQLFRNHPQAFVRFAHKHHANYHEYEIETIWGANCQGFTTETDEGAQLLGRRFSHVIVGEGSHVSKHLLETRIWRALDSWLAASDELRGRVPGGFLFLYTTPRGYEGCSASEWERVLRDTRGKPELLHLGNVPFSQSVWLREAAVTENPLYDRKVFAARQAGLDPAAFAEQYLGKMIFRQGRVFEEFDDSCVVPLPPPEAIREMRFGVGIDTGAFSGIVLAGVDRSNRKWILGEVYTQRRTLSETVEELKEMLFEILGPALAPGFAALGEGSDPDNAFPFLRDAIDVWSIDPASQHKLDLAEMIEAGLTYPGARSGEAKFEVLPTVELLRTWFAAGELLVVEDCTYLIDQLRKYHWRVPKPQARDTAGTPITPEPKKGYDHLIDAARIALVPLAIAGPADEIPIPLTVREAIALEQRERVFGPLREWCPDWRRKT